MLLRVLVLLAVTLAVAGCQQTATEPPGPSREPGRW